MLRIITIVVILAHMGTAFAAQSLPEGPPPIEEGREELIETELPRTQHDRELDISLRPNASDAIKEDYIRSPIRIKYGLTDNWDITLSPLTYFDNFLKGHFGLYMTDLRLATKYNAGELFGQGINTAFSFSALIPVRFDTRISDGYYHYTPAILLSRQLRFSVPVEVGLSIGTSLVSGDGPEGSLRPNDTLSTGLSATFRVRRISYAAEAAYITDEVYGGETESAYITPSIHLDVRDWLKDIPGVWTFGTGVRIGLMDAPEDFEFIIRLKLHLRLGYRFDLREMRLKRLD